MGGGGWDVNLNKLTRMELTYRCIKTRTVQSWREMPNAFSQMPKGRRKIRVGTGDKKGSYRNKINFKKIKQEKSFLGLINTV